jgi:hypothetical protein
MRMSRAMKYRRTEQKRQKKIAIESAVRELLAGREPGTLHERDMAKVKALVSKCLDGVGTLLSAMQKLKTNVPEARHLLDKVEKAIVDDVSKPLLSLTRE